MVEIVSENRFGMALVRGVLWGMVGAVYAALFVALWQVFSFHGLGTYAFFLAATLAGAAGAAVYGSMQAAIIGTVTGIVASTAYMVTASKQVALWEVVLVAAAAGALLGGVFRLPAHFTRGAPAKALAGLGAGAFAGLVVALFKWGLPALSDIRIIAGLLVVATGIVYVSSVNWWVNSIEPRIPRFFLNALVSAVVSAIVGGSVWILGGPVVGVVGLAHDELLQMVRALSPSAMVGGAIAGAASGALLELFGFEPDL